MSSDFLFSTEHLKVRDTQGLREVWDPARKKWVAWTPEELVRQGLIHYLHTEKGIPIGLMSIERGLQVNNLFRRADIVVYSRLGHPLLLAECKAPDVPVSQAAFDQAARYNLTLHVPWLLVTNGLKLFCCRIDFDPPGFSFLSELPSYSILTGEPG